MSLSGVVAIAGTVQRRRRRTAAVAREEALESAKRLLLERGPGGITLMAVADDLGMTHGNLIHHFGSADELQTALMAKMVDDLSLALENAVLGFRSDEEGARGLVNAVFDAFDQGGAGMLAAWLALSKRQHQLEPVRAAVTSLINAINQKFAESRLGVPRYMHSAILIITLCAFGDAVIGQELREMLGRDEDSTRRFAARLLPSFF